MKNESGRRMRVCPLCGKTYSDPSALSRADGKTAICPDCGTREALRGLGIDVAEQDAIIETIHHYIQK